jgi:hypothetical protein
MGVLSPLRVPAFTKNKRSRDQQGAIRKKTPSLCALTGNSPHLQAALLSPGVCDLPCGMSLQARIVSAHFDSHQRVISAVRLTSLGLSALIIIGLPSRRELRRDRRSHPTDDFRRIRLSATVSITSRFWTSPSNNDRLVQSIVQDISLYWVFRLRLAISWIGLCRLKNPIIFWEGFPRTYL